MIEGIDVSSYQIDVDYEKVKEAGKEFIIAKATEGFMLSSEYHRHRRGAKAQGIIFGAYHFARPGSQYTATQQAKLHLAYALIEPGDLRPVLDIEASGGKTPEALTAWCVEYAQTIKSEIGRMPIIYTSPHFWNTYLGDTTALRDLGCALWVAHWDTNEPALFGGWTRWRIWQYTDEGRVPGVDEECDLDRIPDWDYIIYSPPEAK